MSAAAGDLTREELAAEIKVDVRTLERWQAVGFGPEPYRAGRGPKAPVRYTRAAVDAFKRAQAIPART